ncbi:chemotaxis protein CheA [Aestuariivita boseongensis]|uniref:chemotaxis protein CheA n=1 Tax=Aestuariivita boseongensis TaxID=1470562 RepID=UPI0006828559|nr:chemotaxis protein CheA [Aestuariivita boseongensis]
MSMDSLKATFFAECEDLLDALSEGLAAMSDGTADPETVNAIFRAVHSIKGSGGAFGLEDLVSFAHIYENVLDQIRAETLDVTPAVMKTVLRASDVLAALVEEAHAETGQQPEAMAAVKAELTALSSVGGASSESGLEDAFSFEALPFEAIELSDLGDLGDAGELTGDARYQITFKPERALYENSHDPVILFMALADLGDVVVECDTDALPVLADIDPAESYLSWTVTVSGDVSREEIGAVFEFVEGLCTLEIALEETETLPPVGDAVEPDGAVDAPITAAGPSEPAGKARQSAPQSKRPTLRVDPDRVDRLINTVGELIINQAVISQKVVASGIAQNSDLMADLDDYGFLARDIQEGVMAIRAQPVKPLFQRMARIAREAGDATGKDVNFVMEGEMTEIDKSLVERLTDPMTHLVRNAVDHGLETGDERRAAGKSSQGQLCLSAEHRSGHVMITVRDDGRGLNREKILAKAIERGLVAKDAKLSEAEIDNLLFAPGFSTAETVTNLSGRGVGMDVVLTEIQSMGGRIAISSEPGKGSEFSISLPLTLAVLDGMVVTVAGQTLVLPLSCIIETIRPRTGDIRPLGPNGHVLSIRGAFVPVVSLGAILGLDNSCVDPESSVLVHIQSGGANPVAVSVDDISDQRQVVMKSLEANYGAIPGVSAATILGDGKIALIVDPDAVSKMAIEADETPITFELEI